MGLTFSSILVYYLQRRNDVINNEKTNIDIPDIKIKNIAKSNNNIDIILT